MFKGDDEMREFIKKYGSILLITILIGALISVFISMAVYGRIGMTGNQATMYAGFLGLVGGIVGAFSAYFIARMQMTKQLDLQFEKEKHKMVLELELENNKNKIMLISIMKQYIEKLEIFIPDFCNLFDEIKQLELEVAELKLELVEAKELDEFLISHGADRYSIESNDEIIEKTKKEIQKKENRLVKLKIDFKEYFENGKELIKNIQSKVTEYLPLEMIDCDETIFCNKNMEVLSIVSENFKGRFTKENIEVFRSKNIVVKELHDYHIEEFKVQTKNLKSKLLNYSS